MPNFLSFLGSFLLNEGLLNLCHLSCPSSHLLSISNCLYLGFVLSCKPNNFRGTNHPNSHIKHCLQSKSLLRTISPHPRRNQAWMLMSHQITCHKRFECSFSMLIITIINWLQIYRSVSMSQDNEKQKSINQQKKKTRRTRKDEEGRNFTCPCGKSYLSYPALYTHTKTKHQGKVPKDESAVVVKEQVEEEAENKNPVGQMKQIIDKYFPGDNQYAYPTPLLREDSDYISKIVENWQSVKQAKIEDPSNNLSESVNIILGRFLSDMKNQVKAEGYLYLCDLICSLQSAITDWNQDKNYFNTAHATNLCTCFNMFLDNKYGKKGSPVNNSILTAKVLQNLGVWMFEHRYTNSLIKFTSF